MGMLNQPLPKMLSKDIRSRVIRGYMEEAGYKEAVCFTCGHAADALRSIGVRVFEIGAEGVLTPNRWFTPATIHRIWPALFDATCGHLPVPLMAEIARSFQLYLGDLPDHHYIIPTGSGETITCLRWAYPDRVFKPLYNQDKSTEYHSAAPLSWMVNGGLYER